MSELPKRAVRILRHGVMKETIKSQRYLVKDLVPRWGIGMVWGAPQTMKTFFVLDLALHVAMGRNYQDKKVEQGDVVYCPFEGTSGIVNRLDAFCIGHGIEQAPEAFAVLADPLRFNKRPEDGHRLLIKGIKEAGLKPKLVVLDTLHQSLVGSENSDEDMGFYLNAAKEIGQTFECFVLIVHHTGKMSNDLRGHSSARGDVDMLALCTRTGEKMTTSDMVSVRVEKMKDGKEGTTVHSWVKIADIGTDDDGEIVTSCYLEPAPGPAGVPKGLKDKTQESKAFAVLVQLLQEADVCTMAMWEDGCNKAKISSGNAVARAKAFHRSYEKLRERGLIKVTGSIVEIVDTDAETKKSPPAGTTA